MAMDSGGNFDWLGPLQLTSPDESVGSCCRAICRASAGKEMSRGGGIPETPGVVRFGKDPPKCAVDSEAGRRSFACLMYKFFYNERTRLTAGGLSGPKCEIQAGSRAPDMSSFSRSKVKLSWPSLNAER